MELRINANGNSTDGRLGHDFVDKGADVADGKRFIEKNPGLGHQWGKTVAVEFRISGNEMELRLPRREPGLAPGPVNLDLKCVDHLAQTGDWSNFTVNGDAAPNDRFNYRAIIPSPASR